MEDHGPTPTAMFLSSGDKTDIAQFQKLKPFLVLMLKGSQDENTEKSLNIYLCLLYVHKRENKQLT